MRDRFGIDWGKIRGTHFWKQPELSRRMFFRHAGSALSGYFLLPTRPMETLAKAAPSTIGTAKNVIFILMTGGPSHSDTFDLKEGAWTPAFMAPASYGDLRFPQGLMPKIADQLDSIALVRSAKAWAAVHGLGQTWVQIGRNPTSSLARIAPHIGSVVSLELGPASSNRSLPAFISLNTGGGPGNGYLAPDNAPFYVSPGGNGLGNSAHPNGNVVFDRRYGLLQEMDAETKESGALGSAITEMAQFNLSARKLMYNGDIDRVFTFDQATRNLYGNTGFGNACITARNLLRAKLGTRFIQISIGSWDHHSNIYTPNGPLQGLARQFDNGLGQLLADMKQDGTLDETLVVAMGEFGRTVGAPNPQNGRDHYLNQAVMMAGARIRGKRAIGVTDSEARNIVDPGWSRDREIRPEDIEATIYSALGIDWTKQIDSPLGRTFEYVPFSGDDLYGPINELW
jgi:hypothetical protein